MTSIDNLSYLFIDKTNIKVNYILKYLEDNCPKYREAKEKSEVSKIETIDISCGKGYTSRILKATIFFDDSGINPFVCVIKVPSADYLVKLFSRNSDESKDEWGCLKLETVAMFHNQELIFYKNISHKINGIKIPAFYGGLDLVINSQDGAIIMEYLALSSGCVSSYESLNMAQIESALDELLKLQLYSLTDGKEEKKKFQIKYGEEQSKLFVSFFMSHWETVKKFVPENLISELESDYKKYLKYYPYICHYYMHKLPYIEGNYPVLCHGDLWINNLMYKRDLKGNLTNDIYAIVDWQTIYEGSIGSDIARLFVQCTSPENRRAAEITLLSKYYENLKKGVTNKNECFNMTYEMFIFNYNVCAIDQAFHNILMVGLTIAQLEESENDYILDARKSTLGLRLYFNLKDGFEKFEKIKSKLLNENKI